MAGTLQPLAQNFKIVDENGFPTLYFIKWAQQRQVDISEGITLADLQTYLTDHALREGSGIQFTPNGDLNNSPLIAADVQEILDQISATRGTLLYRGLLGWAALAPDTAGKVLQTNGAGADPSWVTPAAGGGGAVTVIETKVFAGGETSFTFAAIPNTYKSLELELFGRLQSNTSAQVLLFTVNGLTTAIYDRQRAYALNTTLTADQALGQNNSQYCSLPGTSFPAGQAGHGIMQLVGYATAFHKTFFIMDRWPQTNTTFDGYVLQISGGIRTTAPITSIEIPTIAGGAAMAAGSYAVLRGRN